MNIKWGWGINMAQMPIGFIVKYKLKLGIFFHQNLLLITYYNILQHITILQTLNFNFSLSILTKKKKMALSFGGIEPFT